MLHSHTTWRGSPTPQLPLFSRLLPSSSPSLAVPGRVQQLQATALSSTSLVVSWQPPAEEERNGEILDYTVNVTAVQGRGDPRSITTVATSVEVAMLHPYTVYQCSVAARTTVGPGPPTSDVARTLEDGEEGREGGRGRGRE